MAGWHSVQLPSRIVQRGEVLEGSWVHLLGSAWRRPHKLALLPRLYRATGHGKAEGIGLVGSATFSR